MDVLIGADGYWSVTKNEFVRENQRHTTLDPKVQYLLIDYVTVTWGSKNSCSYYNIV